MVLDTLSDLLTEAWAIPMERLEAIRDMEVIIGRLNGTMQLHNIHL